MNRRRAVLALVGLSALPRLLVAQPQRVARIGILSNPLPTNALVAPLYKVFYAELKARGWDEGRNLVVESRYVQGEVAKYPAFANELVSARVELIIATDSQAVDAARNATRTIPIVMNSVSHPVEAGYVASLAHPGGNITGVANESPDLQGKQLELLLSVKPDLKKLGVLWSPHNIASSLGFEQMHVVARQFGVELVSLPVDASAELAPALEKAQHEGVQALWVHATPAILSIYRQIAKWAEKHRLIAASWFGSFTRGGFFWSYAADPRDLARISATFVDRILRGANPAELPVEQPTKFSFVINLKTAKAIGVTIPQSLLQRADEVIE